MYIIYLHIHIKYFFLPHFPFVDIRHHVFLSPCHFFFGLDEH